MVAIVYLCASMNPPPGYFIVACSVLDCTAPVSLLGFKEPLSQVDLCISIKDLSRVGVVLTEKP